MDFEEIKNNFNFFLVVIFVVIFTVGLYHVIKYIPIIIIDQDLRIAISVGGAALVFVYISKKYSDLKNDLYKWKNRDKIENEFNKHMFNE